MKKIIVTLRKVYEEPVEMTIPDDTFNELKRTRRLPADVFISCVKEFEYKEGCRELIQEWDYSVTDEYDNEIVPWQ